jgi:opacity protein-like surface antigen
MKKSMLLVLGLFLLFGGTALAQDDYPKAEVFGGFSILNIGEDEDLTGNRESFYGFQADAAFNVNEVFGIAADFGGQYKSLEIEDYEETFEVNAHVYEYLFGPRFSVRGERATVFGHALFGGVTVGGEGENENAFAMGFGGGVDVNVSEHFAIRPIQFDWILTNFSDDWQNDTVRFGFGIVIK